MLGTVLFQKIKAMQFFSDVNLTNGKQEEVYSGIEKTLAVKLRTDSLSALYIPFYCNEEIFGTDFDVKIPGKDSVVFSKKVDDKDGETKFLILSFPKAISFSSINILCNKNVVYIFSNDFIQSKQYGVPLKFQFLFVFTYIIFITFAYLLFLLINNFIKNFAGKYFLYAILLGCMCIVIWPAFNIPDERVHFNTANYYANIIMGIQNFSPETTLDYILFRECDNLIYPKEFSEKKEFTRDTSEFWGVKDLKKYYSFAFPKILKKTSNTYIKNAEKEVIEVKKSLYFVPHVLGVMFFRIINANQYVLYYGTCLFALVWNALIVAIALFKTKCKNILFFFLALNPAILQSMCHFSYDGAIFAIAISFILYFLSFYKTGNKIDLILSVVCWLVLIPAKSHIYMMLGIIYVFLFLERFKILCENKKNLCFSTVITILISIIAIYICISFFKKPEFIIRDYPTKTSVVLTRSFIISSPVSTIALFFTTVFEKTQSFLLQAVGLLLGVRNIPVNFFLTISYLSILFFVVRDNSNISINKKEMIIFVFVSISISLSIFAGMLISHPYNGMYIGGIQGRYFIPILPLLFMSLNYFFHHENSSVYNNSKTLQLAIPLYVFLVFVNVFEVIMIS